MESGAIGKYLLLYLLRLDETGTPSYVGRGDRTWDGFDDGRTHVATKAESVIIRQPSRLTVGAA